MRPVAPGCGQGALPRALDKAWRPGALAPLLCPPMPLPVTSLKQTQHLQKHSREQGWILIITFPFFLALAV